MNGELKPADNGGPLLDHDGRVVDVGDREVTPIVRAFFAGRVRASGCPHYISAQEAAVGITTCEQCEVAP